MIDSQESPKLKRNNLEESNKFSFGNNKKIA